jgi:hypothetical protein
MALYRLHLLLFRPSRLLKKTHILRCAQSSRYNVLAKYASARRFFARLGSEIFLSSLKSGFFINLLDSRCFSLRREQLQAWFSYLDEKEYPQAAKASPDDFYDNSFVVMLEKSGFLQKLAIQLTG